jgi:hypothetical protein
MKIEISRHFYFQKILKYKNFMKNRPMGANLFRADRRTYMTKLIVAFHNFAKSALKFIFIICIVVPCIVVPGILKSKVSHLPTDALFITLGKV